MRRLSLTVSESIREENRPGPGRRVRWRYAVGIDVDLIGIRHQEAVVERVGHSVVVVIDVADSGPCHASPGPTARHDPRQGPLKHLDAGTGLIRVLVMQR